MSGKKRIKWWHILLSFILVILVALGAVAALQYKNIMALYKGVTTDGETLKQAISDNQKETADALTNAGMNVSQDDFDKMNNGELTKEEISDILYNSLSSGTELVAPDDTTPGAESEVNTENTESAEATPEKDVGGAGNEEKKPVEENKPDKNKSDAPVEAVPEQPVKQENEKKDNPTVSPEQQPEVNSGSDIKQPAVPEAEKKPQDGKLSEAEYNKKVADLVAQMYVIKSNFIGTLDSFEDKIMSAWDAQPKEMKTQKNKAKIIAENTAYLVGLEAQCDAQVKAVTDELRQLIKSQGKDTSLVDSILTAYEKEKENRKAYYISEYS